MRRARFARTALALVACGSLLSMPAGHADPAATVGTALGVCDPIDPSACLLPFPNDFFTVADPSTATHRRLNLNVLGMPRNVAGVPIDPTDYNRDDGFSPGALIVTHVPGLATPAAFTASQLPPITNPGSSLAPASPIVLLDATTGTRWPFWSELDRSRDLSGNPPAPADTALEIRPARNLAEGHRYIVALRSLRNASGAALKAQPAFAAFIAGHGASAARQQHYNHDIFPALLSAGVARGSSLYLAWDFTVASAHSLSERVLQIRDDAFAKLGDSNLGDGVVQGNAPRFVVDTVTGMLPCRPSVGIDVPPVSCDSQVADPRIARHVEGRIFVPCYLDAPGCPEGSRFAYADPTSSRLVPIPGNMMAATFQCNIPQDGGDPATVTYRPSLYGHGLLGSADEVNSGKLYELGRYGLMLCATDWVGMASEDLPNDVEILADLGRFPTLADRMQQGFINFLYLGRALINPKGFCSNAAFRFNGHCAIDTSHLYYDGGSQGGIAGGALTAISPDFTRAHLGVPGMNYSTLLRRSSDFDTYAQVMYRAYPKPLQRTLALSLIQTLWDRAEADGYAEHMISNPYPHTPSHVVLMTEAFGDHQVTNWATEVEARTLAIPMRTPQLDPGRIPSSWDMFWGIPSIPSYPYASSAIMIGDVGPLRPCAPPATSCEGAFAGTNPPPTDETPNESGVDPHGPDWSEQADGIAAIGAWLRPNGTFGPVCGTTPCYLAGYQGP